VSICNSAKRPVLLAIVTTVAIFTLPAHAQSEADCAARADRAARDSSGALGSAVVGGAGGAVFGGIVGGSRGAKRGAVLGGIVGGGTGAYKKNSNYKRVYDDCMRGK